MSQAVSEETASFDLPEKPVRKAGEAELLALCAVADRQTGPVGRQGSWKHGPGRPRKAGLVGRPPQALEVEQGGQETGSLVPLSSGTSSRALRRQKQQTPGRVDLSVEQKHEYCQAMAVQFRETGASRNFVFQKWARQIGCRAQTVRKVWDHRVVWQREVEKRGSRTGLAARGVITGRAVGRPARLRSGRFRSTGKRQPGARGYLGPTDPLRAERQALKAWGEAQEACGHSLGRWDLFREFRVLVQARAAQLEAKQSVEHLTEEEQATAEFAKARLEGWHCKKKRDKAALNLLQQTGFRERATNRQTKLGLAEETPLVEKAWRFFDYLVCLTGQGAVEDLAAFVGNPEQFRLHANETAVTFTDQIPVWLKVEAGTQLVSEQRLQQQHKGQADRRKARQLAQLRRQSGEGPAESTCVAGPVEEQAAQSYLVRGPGSTEAARWRVSLLARQAVEHHFDANREPTGNLRLPRQHHPSTT